MKALFLFLRRRSTVAAACLAAPLLLSNTAQGGYIISVSEIGSNVIAQGSGDLDLTGLTGPGLGADSPRVDGSTGTIVIGASAGIDVYGGAIPPTSFGTGLSTAATSGVGDIVGIAGIIGNIGVPVGFTGGSLSPSSATWTGTSIFALGLTPGSYHWTWGTGVDQAFEVNIGPTVVPEAGESLVVLCGLSGLLLGSRRRKRA